MDNIYIELIITAVGTVVWYLLRQKDESQAKDIHLLWQKHDIDAKELQDLKLHVAEGHYKKTELDAKLEKLETAFRQGFTDLGTKFDKLTDALISHMQREDQRG